MSEERASGGETAWWARFTLFGGITAALLLALGPIGYRLDVLGVTGAVLVAPGMAAALAAVTLCFALFGVFMTLRRGLVAERTPVLVGGVLALAIVLNVGAQFSQARSVPGIHDITTSPSDPPRFEAIRELRGPNANSLDYDASALGPLTREAYPEVETLVTDLPPDAAFDRALALAEDMGWEIVATEPGAGRIEATDATTMYGFEDDVVIRVRGPGDGAGGSRVDLRSASRVGVSDLGANAARIRAFLERF